MIDFELRQLRQIVTAVSAQRLFWIQQEALARAANDAELGSIAGRLVRDHERILEQLQERLAEVQPMEPVNPDASTR